MQEYRYVTQATLERRVKLTDKFRHIITIVAVTGLLLINFPKPPSIKAILAALISYGILWLAWASQKGMSSARAIIDQNGFRVDPFIISSFNLQSFEWRLVKDVNFIKQDKSWGYDLFEICLFGGKIIKLRADYPDSKFPLLIPENPSTPDFCSAFRALWGKPIPERISENPLPGSQDIGAFPLAIVAIAVCCLIASFFFIGPQKAIHPENYFWIKLIPISLIAGVVISAPTWFLSKSLPTFSVCAVFLSLCLNFLIVQYIELDSEKMRTSTFSPFIYYTDRRGYQLWKSRDENINAEFGINEIWKGFVPAKIGEIRYFPVVIGTWGNIVIKPEPSRSGPFDDRTKTIR